MGRSRRQTLVSLLMLLQFSSPAAATTLSHSEVIEGRALTFYGRRSLLQAPSPSDSLVTPPVAPLPSAAQPPPVAAPSPSELVNSPPVASTPQVSLTPQSPGGGGSPIVTPGAAPPNTPAPPITTPTVPTASPPAGPVTPLPAPPPVAPAPAPAAITRRQHLNAIIAGTTIGGVILIGIICLFCRCRCLKREKKLPFQRLQMT